MTSKIRWRRLSLRAGSEGPRHDPYSYRELTLDEHRNGHVRVVVYHGGLGEYVMLNGRRVAFGDASGAKFQALTGMTPEQFETAHERIHPYCWDPMGCPAMYE